MDLTAIGVSNSFFSTVAGVYAPQIDLVIKGGKLIDADGWGNVARHCLVQAAAVEVLGGFLGLSNHDIVTMGKVAACHDWRKRLDKRPDDFTTEDKELAERLLKTADPNKELMAALTPWFLVHVLKGRATLLELVQFYVDDIALGGKIVLFDERVDEVSARNPDPEPQVREALGRPYWDVEREVGRQVENMLFGIIKTRRVLPGLKSPMEIPTAIRGGIAELGGVELDS